MSKERNDTIEYEYERMAYKREPQKYLIQAITDWKRTRGSYKLINLPLLGQCGTSPHFVFYTLPREMSKERNYTIGAE